MWIIKFEAEYRPSCSVDNGAGVPMTCKESHAVEGLLHTWGVTARRLVRAEHDAECVQRLRAVGIVPVAVSNVPEANKWSVFLFLFDAGGRLRRKITSLEPIG